MRRISTAIFPLALAALLALLTFWLQRAANPEDPSRKADKRHDPDYVIGAFTVHHFDEKGSLKQSLTALTMMHYPDDNSTQIEKPDMVYYTGTRTTLLKADSAQLSHDSKQVFLHGNVRLIRPPLNDIPLTVMQTEALTVFPDDDLAQGTLPVSISRGESLINGNSIQYNGRSSVTILAGRVRGTFYRTGKS